MVFIISIRNGMKIQKISKVGTGVPEWHLKAPCRIDYIVCVCVRVKAFSFLFMKASLFMFPWLTLNSLAQEIILPQPLE